VAYLCCLGRLELYRMMVSVNVGFLYMANFQLVGVLWMVMSRKFSWLSVPCSAVNNGFGCILLKSSMILWRSEWLESYMINMSSTYLKYPAILCLSDGSGMWMCSRCCRKNSAKRPEVGAPMARPPSWIKIIHVIITQFITSALLSYTRSLNCSC